MTTTPVPAKPAPETIVRYVLYYRQGRNPHTQFLYFDFPSQDMKRVVERSKRHCDIMSYRFVDVRPMMVDLDKEESFINGNA